MCTVIPVIDYWQPVVYGDGDTCKIGVGAHVVTHFVEGGVP